MSAIVASPNALGSSFIHTSSSKSGALTSDHHLHVPQVSSSASSPLAGHASSHSMPERVFAGPSQQRGATTDNGSKPSSPRAVMGCSHLLAALKQGKHSLENYRLAIRWSFKLSISHHVTAQLPSPLSCSICERALSRPFLCLDCGSLFCGPDSRQPSHLEKHVKDANHYLYWDLRSQAMFCTLCRDYTYHPSIERLIVSESIANDSGSRAGEQFAPSSSRRLLPRPGSSTSFLGGRASEPSIPRGIRNLGQTCYLNVILQSFIHNPILRAHYLADQHNRDLCDKNERNVACLACEMDRLYSECSSHFEGPYGPIEYLYAIWQTSAELSGYAQQDAHECLISALNDLHASSPGSTSKSCRCIVHSTYSGKLRSQVRCGRCSTVTCSTDPFLDLSLDLKGDQRSSNGWNPEQSLSACLERFTRSEQLAPSAYKCAACGDSTHPASKQLSIDQLPPVLCIQLKRFEHTSGSHKIDTPVRFPLNLDMKQFLSKDSHVDRNESTLYELNSLITHEGTLTNGHYTAMCKGPDDYWHFDDEKVRRATLKEVLDAKGAYLLIYMKAG